MKEQDKQPKVEKHDCAEKFLNDLGSLSPTWKLKIAALMDERSFTASQALGSLAAFALDTDQYLVVPDHQFFNDIHVRPAGTRMLCPVCDREFELQYPGQPICGNDCSVAYYAKQA